MLNIGEALVFVGMAAGLLGSPGPGIAALVATGRERGFANSLPFFLSMQLGLLVALVICALGLSQLILAIPRATFALSLLSAGYLLYLGLRIATAPVETGVDRSDGQDFGWFGGFFLGAANPKAYIAFIALLGSAAVVGALGSGSDLIAKITLSMGVTLTVDAAWMFMGVALGLIAIGPKQERVLNLIFGALLICTAVLAVLELPQAPARALAGNKGVPHGAFRAKI